MSYQAAVSPLLSQGWTWYTTDKIDYQPTLITRFHVSHDDRYALRYMLGIGENVSSPDWSKTFFNYSYYSTPVPFAYPETNIVLDISDGLNSIQTGDNDMFMRAQDYFFWNDLDGEITYYAAENLITQDIFESPDPPVYIPDDYSFAYAYLDYTLPVEENTQEQPLDFRLNPPYPNPFNNRSTVSFTLGKADDVNLSIYDINGREITCLIDEHKSAGLYRLTFDAEELSSGVYFARLETTDHMQTCKLLLIK